MTETSYDLCDILVTVRVEVGDFFFFKVKLNLSISRILAEVLHSMAHTEQWHFFVIVISFR